jgi:predicted CXXCH cytochrome family protein
VTALVLLLALIASGDSPTQEPASAQSLPAPTSRSVTAGYEAATRGGPHDFPEFDRAAGSSCSACHIPHVQQVRTTTQPASPADAGTNALELSEPAVELFRIQGQRQTFVQGRYTPGPTSLICLGCHDGAVATSVIGSAHAMLAGVREGFSVPDGFVWRDHPIGVPYPTSDRQYRPLSFVSVDGKVRLPEGRLECISCHDPHDASGVPKMLVMSNRRSALCLTCHVK